MSRNTFVKWLLATLLSLSSFPSVGAQEKKDLSPFSFAIVSDPQIGMVRLARDRENFAKVVKAINELKSGVRPRLVIIAGDLVHHGGNQEELGSFVEVEKTFATPVYVIPGNHDMAGDGKHFEPSLLDRYRKVIGPDRFGLKQADCLFVGLNSQLWIGAASLAEEQFKWLELLLRHRDHYRHIFIIQHHPLYLASADEADEYFNTPLGWRTRLLRLFEKARVTAVFTGHLHRNQSNTYRGIAMITTPSSCRNFDGSAFGYALVTITDDGFSYRYVGVPGTLPDEHQAR
ncbi:MAG TPA: metallophosphoesterase [Pyrinomonadaceae bacterium]|jgi:3',5'-cyclic AMP phosphodiesterase CpdA|nr:metallophosphoesterase [Pyrinomonadaceae bacterium]